MSDAQKHVTVLSARVKMCLPHHQHLYRSDVAVAAHEPLVGGQRLKAHGAARVQLLRADADLGAQAKLAAVGELCRRVHVDGGRVYLVLWFDTEDYILPQSDDAAKRVALFLTQQNIRATFKVVGGRSSGAAGAT